MYEFVKENFLEPELIYSLSIPIKNFDITINNWWVIWTKPASVVHNSKTGGGHKKMWYGWNDSTIHPSHNL